MKSFKYYLYHFLIYIHRPFKLLTGTLVFLGAFLVIIEIIAMFTIQENMLTAVVFTCIGFLFSFFMFMAGPYHDLWLLKLNPYDTELTLS